ncbi:GNAT family N-acetyltransferase [Microtetraspora malaysiensis]|uniref:GNAT family N-acetyltransferase n=1 Tax=Microtetraspora malaysiensis TaxID=161358 RepID=UPI003D9114CA
MESPIISSQAHSCTWTSGEGEVNRLATSTDAVLVSVVWKAWPVPVTLRPMDARRLPAWLERSRAEYAKDLVASGQTSEDADRHADESMARFFPSGAPTPGHVVFDVVDDAGVVVGYLWIGPDTSGDAGAWWVWDIVIDADRRGRGLGRRAMVLGEEYARAQGAHTLGLSVFGFNTGARGLYESLGYETTSVKMRKKLG